MTLFSWTATVLVVALIVAFGGYLVSLRKLPLGRRTDLRVFDRFGRVQSTARVDLPRRK